MSSLKPENGMSLAEAYLRQNMPSKVAPYRKLERTTGNKDYDRWYDEEGKANDVDPNLLFAQGFTESTFDPTAVSPKNARGIAQFIPDTAAEFGVDVNDPRSSIGGQARLMRKLLDRTGDIDLSLAGYNSGHNLSIDKLRRNKDSIPETKAYVAKIRKSYDGNGATANPTSLAEQYLRQTPNPSEVNTSAPQVSLAESYLQQQPPIATQSEYTDPYAQVAANVQNNGANRPATETTATLEAQRIAKRDPASSRIGLLYTDPATAPPIDEDEIDIVTPSGTLRADRTKFYNWSAQSRIGAEELGKGADFTPLIGGKVENVGPNGATGNIAVVTRDGNGNELVASEVSSPTSVPAEAASQKKQFPNTPTTTKIETKDEVLAGRSALDGVDPSQLFGGNVSVGKDVAAQRYGEHDLLENPYTPPVDSALAGSPEYQGYETGDVPHPYDPQVDLEKRFSEWLTVNKKPRDNKSMDEFNAVLKAEGDVAQKKKVTDFLAKSPKLVKWAAKNGKSLNTAEEVNAAANAYNSSLPGYQKYLKENRLPDNEDSQEKFNQFQQWQSKQVQAKTDYIRKKSASAGSGLYDFQQKGYLDIPGDVGRPGMRLSYDKSNQKGLNANEYRFTDPDGDSFIYTPNADKPWVNEADATILTEVTIPLPEAGTVSLESAKRSQAEIVANAIAEKFPQISAKDAADYLAVNGFNDFNSQRPLDTARFYRSQPFVNPLTGLSESPTTDVFKVTQRDINGIQAFAKQRQQQQEQVAAFESQYKAAGESDEYAKIHAQRDAGLISASDAGEMIAALDKERGTVKKSLEMDYTPWGAGMTTYVPSVSSADIEAEIARRRREYQAISDKTKDDADYMAAQTRDLGPIGNFLGTAFASAGGKIDTKLAGLLRPVSGVPVIQDVYDALREAGQTGMLIGQTNSGKTWSGYLGNITGAVGSDLLVLAALSKIPGLNKNKTGNTYAYDGPKLLTGKTMRSPIGMPIVFALDAAMLSSGEGKSWLNVGKDTAEAALIGKVFTSATALGRLVKQTKFGKTFTSPAQQRLWATLSTEQREAVVKMATTMKGDLSDAARRSLMASKLTGEGVTIGVIGAGTGAVKTLAGHKEDAPDAIATNILFHLAMSQSGNLASGIKGISGRILRVWKDGKFADYWTDLKGRVRRAGNDVPASVVDMEVDANSRGNRLGTKLKNVPQGTPVDPTRPQPSPVVETVQDYEGVMRPADEYVGNRGNRLDGNQRQLTTRTGNPLENPEPSPEPIPLRESDVDARRMDTPDPQAVAKLSDKRVRKVMDALRDKDFTTVADLAKATRLGVTNVEDAALTLYGAGLAEIKAGNRIRLIDSPEVAKATDIFEKAASYGQTPDVPAKPQNIDTKAGRVDSVNTSESEAVEMPEFAGKQVTHPVSKEVLTFTGKTNPQGNLIATNNFGRERIVAVRDANSWLNAEGGNIESPAGEREAAKPNAQIETQTEAATAGEVQAPAHQPTRSSSKLKSLSQFVRANGGIRSSTYDKGEHRRISNKETGTTGLINKNSKYTAEQMAEQAWEAGYLRDEWPEMADRNGNDFMGFVEDDLHGIRKHYSTADSEELGRTIEEHYDHLYNQELEQKAQVVQNSGKTLAAIEEQGYATDDQQREIERAFTDAGLDPQYAGQFIEDVTNVTGIDRSAQTTAAPDQLPAKTNIFSQGDAWEPEGVVDASFDPAEFESASTNPARDAEQAERLDRKLEDLSDSEVSALRRDIAPKTHQGKGTLPSEAARAFGLPESELAKLPPLPEVGQFGQTSHIIKSGLSSEDSDEVYNAFARVFAPKELRDIDPEFPEMSDRAGQATNIVDAIARDMDFGRSSQMDADDWGRFLDKHADKLGDDAVNLILSALDHQQKWHRNIIKFVGDPELDPLIKRVYELGNLGDLEGFANPRWGAVVPPEFDPNKPSYDLKSDAAIKKEVLRIGRKYGIEQARGEGGLSDPVIKQTFLRAVRRTVQEELANRTGTGSQQAANRTSQTPGETSPRRGQPEELSISPYATPEGRAQMSDARRQAISEEYGLDPVHDKDIIDSLIKGGDVMFADGETNPLVAIHNLSASNLDFANRMGGLALPSVAITSPNRPFSGYGEISLIADKSLIDPKAKVPVTNADMYSPRYPTAKIFVNPKKFEAIWNDVRENWLSHYEAPKHRSLEPYTVISDLQDRGLDALRNNEQFQAYAITAKGGTLPKDVNDLYKTVRDYYDEIDEVAQQAIDQSDAQMKFFKGFTYAGSRRYGKYDLETVVRQLKSEMKDGEGYNYGAGSVRAKAAKKFKSINQIQAARGDIADAQSIEAIKDEMQDRLWSLGMAMQPYYKYTAEGMRLADTFADALAEGSRSRAGLRRTLAEYGFENIPNEQYQEITQYLTDLTNAPTEYFEAKPQRAVGLNEFRVAVIPDDTSDKTRKILASHGLPVVEYKSGDNNDRQRAVAQASTQSGTQFSNAFDQVNLFGEPVTPQTSQPSLFSKLDAHSMQAAMKDADRKGLEKVFGVENAKFLHSILDNPEAVDPKTYRAAVKISDGQFLVAAKGLTKIADDAVDALDVYNYARDIDTPIAEILPQQSFDGKTYEDKLSPQAVEFAKSIERGDFAIEFGKALNDAPSNEVRFMVAWHGSPHKFDKFDSSKIGTGEGAQAYGHGLYFASDEDIATHYRNKLATYTEQHNTYNGKRLTHPFMDELVKKSPAPERPIWEAIARQRGWQTSRDTIDKVLASLDIETARNIDRFRASEKAKRNPDSKIIASTYSADDDAQMAATYERRQEAIQKIREGLVHVPGKLNGAKYKVDLKPTEDEYLLWDKPLSGQSEKVQKALDFKVEPAIDGTFKITHQGEDFDSSERSGTRVYLTREEAEHWLDRTGEQIYKKVGGRGSPDKASEYLKSLGIRGIKYLDGSSRGKGEGSYNYVIFDDADVEITDVQFSARDRAKESQIARRLAKPIAGNNDATNVRLARFAVDENGVLRATNMAGLKIVSDAVKSFQNSVPSFSGFYLDKGQTFLFRRAFEMARINAIEHGQKAAADAIGKTIAYIEQATDPVHRDLTFAIDIPELPQMSQTTVQEELAHRNNERSGAKETFVTIAETDAIKKGLANLSPAYANMSVTGQVDEVSAKSLREDAETELDLDTADIVAIWSEMVNALDSKGITDDYIRSAKEIGPRGQEFADYATNEYRQRNFQTQPERAREVDSDSRSEARPRREGAAGGTRTVQDEPDRFARLRQTEVSPKSASPFGKLTLADRKWIERQPLSLQRDLASDIAFAANPDIEINGRTFGQKVRNVAVDLTGIPRAVKSSFDLSAPGRQGLISSINHPIIATKAFAKQLSMLPPKYGAKQYEKFKQYLDLHPYIELAEESGLHLTSLGHGEITHREEAFLSRIMGDDPYFRSNALEKSRQLVTSPVRISERAYVTYLDHLRINSFAQLARQIHEYNARKGNPDTIEQYKGLATWINNATGRGDLGRLNGIAPELGAAFFSPRYWSSRLRVLSPNYYYKLPPGARKIAIRQMLTFVAAAGTVMAIMKAAGFKVEVDPRKAADPDFVKIRIGDYSYDISAGLAPHLRFIARMVMAAQSERPAETMKNLTSRYFRSKLAPIPGAAVNTLDGKDFIGKPTSLKKESLGLITPIMVDNFLDAAKADGSAGVIRMAPEFFGVGVTNYKK